MLRFRSAVYSARMRRDYRKGWLRHGGRQVLTHVNTEVSQARAATVIFSAVIVLVGCSEDMPVLWKIRGAAND